MLSIITATYNRPGKLKNICLPSILSQTSKDFEWVIVNDGANEETREVVNSIDDSIRIKYIETKHQGLCCSRNRGLDEANGDLIGFLDDDNQIYEKFVEKMTQHFNTSPKISSSMAIQDRRRDCYKDGKLIRKGKDFFAPQPGTNGAELVTMKGIFDSNGFVHIKNDSIRFDVDLLILSDYDYMLKCFGEFGVDSFSLLEEHLVRYVQTSDGIIGESRFRDWLNDFEYIWTNRSEYKIFELINPESWMPDIADSIRKKAEDDEDLPGFPKSECSAGFPN